MKKKKIKAISFILCAVLSVGSVTYIDTPSVKKTVSALTLEDIDQQKSDNDKKIEDLDKEIEALEGKAAEEEEYQEALQKKIDLQNENISLVDQKLEDLNKKINDNQEKIDQLNKDIARKQEDIDKGMEEFKSRLRAMYISGNDSLASALVGATDFYDMLSKIELISQVSKHDSELIESLTTQLQQFKESQAQLDIEQTELDANVEDQKKNREEFNDALDELQELFSESQTAKEMAALDLASAQRSKEDIQADNEALAAEEDKIYDVIAKQQAATAAQPAAEEEDEDDYDDTSYSNDSYDDGSNDDGGSSDDYSEPASSGSYSYSGGSLSWPVPGSYNVSSEYGYRWGTNHNGMDLAAGAGSTITAAEGGTVIMVSNGCTHNYPKDGSCGCGGGYGNYVIIDHGNGISTLYGHCTSVFVSVGQSVSRGEAIASVGTTGYSTGNHCHFEVREGGSPVNPRNYL